MPLNETFFLEGFYPNHPIGKYVILPITEDFNIRIRSIRKKTRKSTIRLNFTDGGEPYIRCQYHIPASQVRDFVLKNLDFIKETKVKYKNVISSIVAETEISIKYGNYHQTTVTFDNKLGKIILYVPIHMKPISQDAIDNLIENRKETLSKAISKWRKFTNSEKYCQFNHGDLIPLWGKRYKLCIINLPSDQWLNFSINHDEEILSMSIPEGQNYTFYKERLFVSALERELSGYLKTRYSELCNLMNESAWKLSLQYMKNCFGKCYQLKHEIKLNINLAMYSKEFVDSVVIHEIAHMKIHNHPPKFYDHVLKYCPNYFELDDEVKADSGFYNRFVLRFV